jgi:CheY-specific phosphatase CheX/anti-anti-sigma regulatory factor
MNENRELESLVPANSEFGIFPHESYLVVRAFEAIDETGLLALSKLVEAHQNKRLLPIVMDCLAIHEFSPAWIRFIAAAAKALGQANLKFLAVNCSEGLHQFMAQANLESILPVAASWSDAMKRLGAGAQTVGIDATLVEPFLGAAANMIATQMGTPCKTGTMVALQGSAFKGDISGLIALECRSMRAIVALSFPKETIFSLVGKMVGAPPTEVNSMVRGSVGEITNVAFTRGKKVLNEMGLGVKSAVPSVVEVSELPPEYWQYSGPAVVIPFETDCGVYYAEIRFAA